MQLTADVHSYAHTEQLGCRAISKADVIAAVIAFAARAAATA
jgi:hypothetical protein